VAERWKPLDEHSYIRLRFLPDELPLVLAVGEAVADWGVPMKHALDCARSPWGDTEVSLEVVEVAKLTDASQNTNGVLRGNLCIRSQHSDYRADHPGNS